MSKKICYNCKHSGTHFKLSDGTHMHCEHPSYEKEGKAGNLSPWETLRKWWDKCNNFKIKRSL
jgi:hypothetical protein